MARAPISNVSVIGTQEVKGFALKKDGTRVPDVYTSYIVQIESPHSAWTVLRRYSSFTELHRMLTRLFRAKKTAIPPLPSRPPTGEFASLSSWLQALLSEPDLLRCVPFQDFLAQGRTIRRGKMESPALPPGPPPRVPSPAPVPSSSSGGAALSDSGSRAGAKLADSAGSDKKGARKTDEKSRDKAESKDKSHKKEGGSPKDKAEKKEKDKGNDRDRERDALRVPDERHGGDRESKHKTEREKEKDKDHKDKAKADREGRSKDSNGRGASASHSHSRERDHSHKDAVKEREVKSAQSSPHSGRRHTAHVERASSLDQSLTASGSGKHHARGGSYNAAAKEERSGGVRFRADDKSAASTTSSVSASASASASASNRGRDDASDSGDEGTYSTVRIKDQREEGGSNFSTVRIKDDLTDSSSAAEAFNTMRVKGSPPDSEEEEEDGHSLRSTASSGELAADAYREPEAWELSIISFERGEWDPNLMQEDAWRKYRHHRPRLYSSFIKQPIDFSKHPPPPALPPKPVRNTK